MLMHNTDYFDRAIAQLDKNIAELTKRRLFFEEIRNLGLSISTLSQREIAQSGKSYNKYRTLFYVVQYLQDSRTTAKTKNILNFIRNGFSDNRNERTIRSHLKRLRDERHLCYDNRTKTWSLPP